jgi:hypothetical protein
VAHNVQGDLVEVKGTQAKRFFLPRLAVKESHGLLDGKDVVQNVIGEATGRILADEEAVASGPHDQPLPPSQVFIKRCVRIEHGLKENIIPTRCMKGGRSNVREVAQHGAIPPLTLTLMQEGAVQE